MIFWLKTKGFSLVELMLSIWLLFLIFATADYYYLQKQRIIEIEVVAEELKATLYEARENSRNYKDNSIYGIHLNIDSYSMFKWSTLTSTGIDLSTTFPNFITIEEINLNGSGSEIVFDKNTGNTDMYGNFKLINDSGENLLFEVNSLGLINLTYDET